MDRAPRTARRVLRGPRARRHHRQADRPFDADVQRAGGGVVTTLSEVASKELLRAAGVPLAVERGVATAHKTERGLVKLRLGDRAAVESAAAELLGAATPDDGAVNLLVAPMIA